MPARESNPGDLYYRASSYTKHDDVREYNAQIFHEKISALNLTAILIALNTLELQYTVTHV